MKNAIKKSRTCVAAIRSKKGKIMMAADRRASWDFSQAQMMPRPKIAKRDGVILAGTGDGYLCTLVVDIFKIPTPPESEDHLDEYMHHDFFKDLNAFLKTKNFKDQHGLLKIPGESYAEIIVAVMGRLYQVVIVNPDPESETSQGLLTIDELNLPYATGCGGSLAWGSLLTLQLIDDASKKEHLTIALTVASEVSPGCDSNIDIAVED